MTMEFPAQTSSLSLSKHPKKKKNYLVCNFNWLIKTSKCWSHKPVTGLCGFPMTCPMHSFIRACKLYKPKKNWKMVKENKFLIIDSAH